MDKNCLVQMSTLSPPQPQNVDVALPDFKGATRSWPGRAPPQLHRPIA